MQEFRAWWDQVLARGDAAKWRIKYAPSPDTLQPPSLSSRVAATMSPQSLHGALTDHRGFVTCQVLQRFGYQHGGGGEGLLQQPSAAPPHVLMDVSAG